MYTYVHVRMYVCTCVYPQSGRQTLLLCVQQLAVWTAEVWFAMHVPQQHYCTVLIYVYSMSVRMYMSVCMHVCLISLT